MPDDTNNNSSWNKYLLVGPIGNCFDWSFWNLYCFSFGISVYKTCISKLTFMELSSLVDKLLGVSQGNLLIRQALVTISLLAFYLFLIVATLFLSNGLLIILPCVKSVWAPLFALMVLFNLLSSWSWDWTLSRVAIRLLLILVT